MTTEQMEKKIRKARKDYYNNESLMSDYAFDQLIAKLKCVKPESKVLTEVGARPRGVVIDHRDPMGSLAKADTVKALSAWLKDDGPFVLMDKLDGCSIGLEYNKGQLVKALTRGNGIKGEDITANAVLMKNVKQSIPGFTGSVRGEAILNKIVFKDKYSEDFANPRNTTAGIMRRHSGEGSEDLEVIFFRMIGKEDYLRVTDMLEDIEARGLVAVRRVEVGIRELEEVFNQWEDEREDYPYECDGVVVAINERALRPEGNPMLPSNQIAYKYAPEIAVTKVNSIKWEASRTGRVNPVVHVEPVVVAGVTVSKITGNNYPWMKAMGVGVGAEIEISRRGDVIPAIENVTTKGRILNHPTACPACDKPVERVGAYLMCGYEFCKEKILGGLQHWVKLVDIKGLGPAALTDVIRWFGTATPADLYKLSKEEYQMVLGKNGGKIFRELRSKLKIPLEVIFAGHIPNIGRRRFQMLMRAGFNTPDKLFNATVNQLEKVSGFSTIIARQTVDGCVEWADDIIELLEHIKIAKPKMIKKDAPLKGYGFKFTGKMAMKRPDMEAKAADAGAETGWREEITNVLVLADVNSNSGKAKTAKKKGYELWTPEEFLIKAQA